MKTLLGDRLVVEITPKVVKGYQTTRLREKAGPKTINDEVMLLIRLCGDQGELIRATLRREKALKLALPPSPGRPYSSEEKARMLEEAQKLRTPQMHAALALDLNTGLRDKELREIRWEQVDFVHKKALTVGRSKTDAGTGRIIPLNETAIAALEAHASWYIKRFGECKPEWFVFAFWNAAAQGPNTPNHIVQDRLDEGAREGRREGALARQPPHARHRARGVRGGRRSHHEHRRPRLARHALPLLPRANGSEAARARRDCHSPARRGREA